MRNAKGGEVHSLPFFIETVENRRYGYQESTFSRGFILTETSFKCPDCANPLEARSPYCDRCGALLSYDERGIAVVGRICFACGHQTDQIADICPNCGTPYRDDEAAKAPVRRGRFWRHFVPALVLILSILTGYYVVARENVTWARIAAFLITIAVFALLVWFVRKGMSRGTIERRKKWIDVPEQGEQLVKIFRAYDSPTAEHAKGVLEAEGIPAFVAGAHFGAFYQGPIPFSDIFVLTPADRAQEAAEVLTAFGFEPYED